MILDTSFLEDVAREDPAAIERGEQLEAESIPQRVSSKTLYEFYWGVGYVDSAAAERSRIDAVLGSKEVYDVTPAVARKAGRIAGSLSASGEPLDDPGDESIGATGVVHDESVLTRHADDFERIPNLDVRTY